MPGATRRRQQLYLWLAALFVAALVVADLIGGKFFRVAASTCRCGMLAFPLTFVLTDVLNEFYGPRRTRRVTYLGLGAAALAFLVINVALRAAHQPRIAAVRRPTSRPVFGLSAPAVRRLADRLHHRPAAGHRACSRCCGG